MTNQRRILLFAACSLLASCATTPEVEDQVEQEVDVLYQDALKTVIGGEPESWSKALSLCDPIQQHRGRCDHKAGLVGADTPVLV